MAQESEKLTAVRAAIDKIDGEIHDLLMARSELVEKIAQAKSRERYASSAGPSHFRPGREAQVIRRILARHQGALPPATLVQIWRELISAFVVMQGPLAVAAYAPDNAQDLARMARNHFGCLVPVSLFGSEQGVIRALTDGRATVAVLPMPQEEARDPWWRYLASGGEGRPRIIARLPFFVGERGKDESSALVVSLGEPEESGEDHSYIIVETVGALSRGALLKALEKVGLPGLDILVWSEGGERQLHLIEVDGFVVEQDPRLQELAGQEEAVDHARAVGSFALPLLDPTKE